MGKSVRDPLVELSRRLRGEDVTGGVYDRRLYESWKKAYLEDRLHHAHLVLGIGNLIKFNTVRRFAASLLCQNPLENGEPCGKCNSCATVFSGTHPGFQVISPSGPSITINQIRELKQEAYRKTAYPKVFIITDAQKMTYQAVSATLKILEEPPGKGTFFFLFAPYPSLPPTIISRSVRETVRVDYELLEELLEGLVPPEEIRVNLEIFGPNLELMEHALRDVILSGDTLTLRVTLGELVKFPDLDPALRLAKTLHRNMERNLKLFIRLAGTLSSLILRVSQGIREPEDQLLLKAFSLSQEDFNENLLWRTMKLVDALRIIKPLEEEVEKFNAKLLSYGISLYILKALRSS